jgi:hypothetical protein
MSRRSGPPAWAWTPRKRKSKCRVPHRALGSKGVLLIEHRLFRGEYFSFSGFSGWGTRPWSSGGKKGPKTDGAGQEVNGKRSGQRDEVPGGDREDEQEGLTWTSRPAGSVGAGRGKHLTDGDRFYKNQGCQGEQALPTTSPLAPHDTLVRPRWETPTSEALPRWKRFASSSFQRGFSQPQEATKTARRGLGISGSARSASEKLSRSTHGSLAWSLGLEDNGYPPRRSGKAT